MSLIVFHVVNMKRQEQFLKVLIWHNSAFGLYYNTKWYKRFYALFRKWLIYQNDYKFSLHCLDHDAAITRYSRLSKRRENEKVRKT